MIFWKFFGRFFVIAFSTNNLNILQIICASLTPSDDMVNSGVSLMRAEFYIKMHSRITLLANMSEFSFPCEPDCFFYGRYMQLWSIYPAFQLLNITCAMHKRTLAQRILSLRHF